MSYSSRLDSFQPFKSIKKANYFVKSNKFKNHDPSATFMASTNRYPIMLFGDDKGSIKNSNNTKLSLSGKGITSLDFLTKYIRENPSIKHLEIANNSNI